MKFAASAAVLICFLSFALFSCEDDDKAKIASAQKCLDDLDETSGSLASEALACENKVSGLTSAESYSIRCAAKSLQGGITTTSIAEAYKNIDDGSATAEAAFIVELRIEGSVNGVSASDFSAQLFEDCEASGVTGYIYLAGLINLGTTLFSACDSSCSGSDAAQLAENLINQCQGGDCTTADLTTIGNTVSVVSEQYCTGGNADSEVCSELTSAIDQAGGDPVAIANALLANLES